MDLRQGGKGADGLGQLVPDPEREGQVGAGAPEGALDLMKEDGLGRMGQRIGSRGPEKGEGLPCPILKEAGADQVGMMLGGRAVADHQQLIREEGADGPVEEAGGASWEAGEAPE